MVHIAGWLIPPPTHTNSFAHTIPSPSPSSHVELDLRDGARFVIIRGTQLDRRVALQGDLEIVVGGVELLGGGEQGAAGKGESREGGTPPGEGRGGERGMRERSRASYEKDGAMTKTRGQTSATGYSTEHG